MAKVAINGFGRIGRAAFKIMRDRFPNLEVTAINDLVPIENLAYLLQYDSAYGKYERSVSFDDHNLVVGGEKYPVLNGKDPAQLPWAAMGIDIVLECTGIFRTREDMEMHRQAGAEYVILSAPAKGGDVPTIVHGVNEVDYDAVKIISCASCTTNCITPLVEVIGRRLGLKKAIMTTIHAYTSSQAIVDGPSSKTRRGRAQDPSRAGSGCQFCADLDRFSHRHDRGAAQLRGPVRWGGRARSRGGGVYVRRHLCH